jgi:hypothetical protein
MAGVICRYSCVMLSVSQFALIDLADSSCKFSEVFAADAVCRLSHAILTLSQSVPPPSSRLM